MRWGKLAGLIMVLVFLPSPLLGEGLYRVFTIDGFYGEAFNNPVAIFFDREKEEVYILDNGKGEILVFNSRGTPLFRFRGLSAPLDLAVREGSIYVVEEGRHGIAVLDYRGRRRSDLRPEGMDILPGRLTFDSKGNLYVTDKIGRRVVVFKDDLFAGTIGKGLRSISAVAVSPERVYIIAPFDVPIVRIYSKDGDYIKGFEGLEGEGGTLGLPVCAEIDRDGNLWLVDALKGIILFSREGREIGRFGGLNFPVDIALGRKGWIYVVEKGARRISVFKRE